MTSPKHLSISNEHYTPADIVEAARLVMGGIDLDPASCAAANQTVKARTYYAQPLDGLALPWFGRVFLNPPGGEFTIKKAEREAMGAEAAAALDAENREARARWNTKSRATAWFTRLCLMYDAKNIDQAVFIGFNIEVLKDMPARAFASCSLCIPRKRVKYSGEASPPHASTIIYLGENRDAFRVAFNVIGNTRVV